MRPDDLHVPLVMRPPSPVTPTLPGAINLPLILRAEHPATRLILTSALDVGHLPLLVAILADAMCAEK
jgi:hypothetical protein